MRLIKLGKGGKILTAILLLFAGTLIYALFRPNVIFLNPLWEILGRTPEALCPGIADIAIGCIFIYSLPDALWYAALLLTQKVILQKNNLSKIIYGLSIALPFILEFLQGLHLIDGTFDWIDLTAYLLTLILII